MDGDCACKNAQCRSLCGADDIESKECDICKQERHSNVMADGNDPRVREDKFAAAPAIFPNNDIKYDVTKTRARIHAAIRKQCVTWS